KDDAAVNRALIWHARCRCGIDSACLGARQEHRECGAVTRARVYGDRHLQHAADALDDRQAETEPTNFKARLIESLELLEDQLVLGLRNAAARVRHLDEDGAVPPPRAEQH